MARIRDSSVRDVVAAADMVEVVSGRTQLRRASGSRFTGRCPFHEEKTPSFHVDPERGFYHCFGCGAGGNAFTFLTRTTGVTFPEAVRTLAERANVTIPEATAARSWSGDMARRYPATPTVCRATRQAPTRATDDTNDCTAARSAGVMLLIPSRAILPACRAFSKTWSDASPREASHRCR